MPDNSFIIDCPWCKAKVAATQLGLAEKFSFDEELHEPSGSRIYLGKCLTCQSVLVGESLQIDFRGIDADEDKWTDVVRVFPKPPKTFLSHRIPAVVKRSLDEAERSLQASANTAACVMLGRALEAVCRDVLTAEPSQKPLSGKTGKKREIMLHEGITLLHKNKIIDQRLFDWSQQLHAFRNIAAHPDDSVISREEAEDLQTFAYAIVEYIYDLTDRYEDFKVRLDRKKKIAALRLNPSPPPPPPSP